MSHNFVKTITPFEFQNHSYQNLLLLHKFTYRKSKLPTVFSTYFIDNQLFCEYNTHGKIVSHSYWCFIGHKYIKYKDCKLWNDLPLDLKSITYNKLCNNKLKICLCSSYVNIFTFHNIILVCLSCRLLISFSCFTRFLCLLVTLFSHHLLILYTLYFTIGDQLDGRISFW